MKPFCNVKTRILPSLKKKTLLKGTFLAGSGGTILLLSALTCSIPSLEKWGLAIFVTSIFLIRAGLYPYRTLCKKELSFDEIHLNSQKLTFYSRCYGSIDIPISDIEKLCFRDATKYGIEIAFSAQSKKKWKEQHQNLSLKNYHYFCLRKYNCDCFFPFFDTKAVAELQACLNDIVHS